MRKEKPIILILKKYLKKFMKQKKYSKNTIGQSSMLLENLLEKQLHQLLKFTRYTKIMNNKIVLASKSKVRKNILENNGFECVIRPANIDEEIV